MTTRIDLSGGRVLPPTRYVVDTTVLVLWLSGDHNELIRADPNNGFWLTALDLATSCSYLQSARSKRSK